MAEVVKLKNSCRAHRIHANRKNESIVITTVDYNLFFDRISFQFELLKSNWYYLQYKFSLSTFVPNAALLYPLKTSENRQLYCK